MPKQPEAMHTQEGCGCFKKTLFTKTGMAGWTPPEGVCYPSSRAPLVGQVENVPVKYGSFHLHK